MQRLYGVAMNVEATDKEMAARIAELPPATRRCVGWLAERIAAAETPDPRDPSRDPRDAPRRDAPARVARLPLYSTSWAAKSEFCWGSYRAV